MFMKILRGSSWTWKTPVIATNKSQLEVVLCKWTGENWPFWQPIGAKYVECVWNLMAHGDAREGKWRGNWRIEWVASTLTLPRKVVYPALLTLMRTTRLPAVDWNDAPRRFKWTRPFRRKTKSGFCTCAITFQTLYTYSTKTGMVERIGEVL